MGESVVAGAVHRRQHGVERRVVAVLQRERGREVEPKVVLERSFPVVEEPDEAKVLGGEEPPQRERERKKKRRKERRGTERERGREKEGAENKRTRESVRDRA